MKKEISTLKKGKKGVRIVSCQSAHSFHDEGHKCSAPNHENGVDAYEGSK